jgi:TonB-dependent SusC/RagA subfamily outer membrane receptor
MSFSVSEARRLARWPARAALLGLVAAMVWAPPAAAQAGQATGSITGQVTSEANAPLSDVQVFLIGTQMGGLTAGNGRYFIRNVPAGAYRIQALRLGYAAVTQDVTVAAGQSMTVNFTLSQQALGLDEIVVTGTAGAARRREVGNSIVQIATADVAAASVNVDQLLQAQSPGVLVSASNGMSGSGAQIRLRGSISVSQTNQPLIYVDGVRVRSDPYDRNISPTEGAGRGGNVTASPLADINPSDIERIEIIKGSAASTLYGTQAAAGVIQIFTKRGSSGAPRWTLQVDQGFNREMPFAPDVDVRPANDPLPEGPRGEYSYKYMNMDPYLRDGYRQKYALGVAGGAQTLQYYLSGQLDDNEGVMPQDVEKKKGVRGNFTFTPFNALTVQVSSAYNRTDIQNTPSGNNAQGLTLNAFRRERNYFGNGDPELIRTIYETQKHTTRIDRFILAASPRR